jgi:type III secretion protein N (ATPase)
MVATVLLEDRDLSDPVGEEVKSLLDGHLVLSPTIASQGRFPAIDLSESISRLASRVASADVTLAATRLRTLLAKHREVQPLVQIGEYSPGADPEADEALALHPDIVSWLSQPIHEASSWADCRDGLIGLVGGGVAR